MGVPAHARIVWSRVWQFVLQLEALVSLPITKLPNPNLTPYFATILLMNSFQTNATDKNPANSLINRTVLMSGANYFSAVGNNPYSNVNVQPAIELAKTDFENIRSAVEQAGVRVIKVDPPQDCPDGVYTANWGLCRGNKAVLSSLPSTRQRETPYVEKALRELGKEVIRVPGELHFSGQGDALPCSSYLLTGSGYRTDEAAHQFLADTLGYEVITLQAVPDRNAGGQPIVNPVTGWPDSFFYDIDLAISVLGPDLIAWCPEAFMPSSQEKIYALPMEKIEVSLKEAKKGFACNLLSTGETVIMSSKAPEFKAAIEARGLYVITPEVSELGKGGGYIRCSTLTLD
jgi:N-dimethylarginine dimethylaminohydrolase